MGVFDGVHLGHQAIIRAAVEMADPNRGLPAVLTFDPHPDAVISPTGAPPLLTTTEEKLALIRSLGIRLTVVARFDPGLAQTPAQEFVGSVLAERLRGRCLIVGDDWRFGARGEGNIALLHRLAPEFGFQVAAVPAVTVGRTRVSSTRIRSLLSRARLAAARACLGRWYGVSGKVVAGDRRGRELGFPTANLNPPAGKLIPPDGVYAGWAGVRRLCPAVISIGVRPTFEGRGERRIEVHLLGHPTSSLLGRLLRVQFVKRLRGERRFPSPPALVRQMGKDCALASCVLALQPPADVLSSAPAGAMVPAGRDSS
jgi:riboflavin kinase/FMN adenylyltransferase